ncbi:spore protease YyaC [Alkalicella caledoniensis]|uniref:Spore protease YyaC n=1 Tax=Alkalicella caledoniensis TaxID=2731377 RepID=A0A7G9W8K6_ALKCA|nr:spore protease YyaC [Alkalicella caledoniensis]QNO15018.1 spore protease YyaC [Alkalicella caledoniensis]
MLSFFSKPDKKLYSNRVDCSSSNCYFTLKNNLLDYIHTVKTDWSDIVIMCIGTDRSTGDSLGPLVGSKIERLNDLDNIHVMGTLDDPVHAANLEEKLESIPKLKNPLVIAIDACLGSMDNVSTVSVGIGSLKPGAGVKKNLPEVGHIYITGVVNVGGFMEYFVLQNTRLAIVMKMANVIAKALESTVLDLTLLNTKKKA